MKIIYRHQLCALCNGNREGAGLSIEECRSLPVAMACGYHPDLVCNLQIFRGNKKVMEDAKREKSVSTMPYGYIEP